MTNRYAFLACLMAAAATLPISAHAFYVESRGTDALVPIRYADVDDPPTGTVDVSYRVNEATFPTGVADVGDAVDAAFATWTTAGCSVLSLTAGPTSDSTSRAHWTGDMGEIYILVYFTDTAEEWSAPAAGHFYFAHDGTGTLVGGTVVLNSRDHSWATDGSADALDVQGVVTALIGRSLGITSAMEVNATFPRYAPGDQSKQMLGADDLLSIAFLYPSDDVICAIPTMPEAECDGIMAPGEEACPPRPTTTPGDGGTTTRRDAGGSMVVDGGGPFGGDSSAVGLDGGGGMGGAEGSCSCRAAGSSRPSSGLGALLITLVFGALLVARRHT